MLCKWERGLSKGRRVSRIPWGGASKMALFSYNESVQDFCVHGYPLDTMPQRCDSTQQNNPTSSPNERVSQDCGQPSEPASHQNRRQSGPRSFQHPQPISPWACRKHTERGDRTQEGVTGLPNHMIATTQTPRLQTQRRQPQALVGSACAARHAPQRWPAVLTLLLRERPSSDEHLLGPSSHLKQHDAALNSEPPAEVRS